MIPSNEKRTPNPVKPSPISVGQKQDTDGLAKVGRNGGVVHCKFATQSQHKEL